METLFEETKTVALINVNPADYGLDENKAQEITKGLGTIIAEKEELKKQYNSIIALEITPESVPQFKGLRLMIRDNRTKGIEVWHKANKAFFLAGGQFVDAIRRREASENEMMEEKLLAAEKFFERQEHDRLEKLRVDRLNMLKPYTDIEPMALGHMEQAVFDNLLQGFKVAHEARIAAEKKAEEDRIAREKAEAEERERMRLENERLKKEAEERERLAEIERQKQAKAMAEQKRKADAERKKIEEQARKEREERERLEAELKAKEEAELKAREDAERKAKEEERKRKAEEKKARLAPDKDKLLYFMQQINDLPRPEVKSIEAADIASKANIILLQAANYIRDTANKL